MLNRRELLTLLGLVAVGRFPSVLAAESQGQKRKKAKLATVTLIISGMT